ncbi:hypothetical protein GCM10028807_51940 [Spirosoma daeguense]
MTGQSYGEGADYATPNQTNGSNTEPNGVSTPQTATSADQPAQTDAGPNLSMDIAPGPDGQIINTNLPVFLTRHFYDPQQYAKLQQALKKVFRVYYDSTRLTGNVDFDEQFNHNMAYHVLELSLSKVLQWGAQKVLGTLPDFPPEVPGDIEENAFQPDAYEEYTHNPYNYTDLTMLQKWVANLQERGRVMGVVIKSYQRQEKVQTKLIDELKDSLEKKSALNDVQARLIKVYEDSSGKINIPSSTGSERIVPKHKADSSITFYLSTTAIRTRSEFDVVKDALESARDEKLKDTLTKLSNDEPWEAACEFEDYKVLKKALDYISSQAAELSDFNYQADLLQRNPKFYANWYTQAFEKNEKEEAEFVEKYSMGSASEEKTSESDEA